MTTQFDKIRFAPAGIAWKALEGEGSIMIQAGDIKYCQWLRRTGGEKLLMDFYERTTTRFSQLVTQHYKTQLETKEISVKGWNWGSTDVQGSDLAQKAKKADQTSCLRFVSMFRAPKGDGDDEDVSAAQAFHDLIKDKADIGQVTGDVLVSFSEVNIQTPRGRYDIDMFPTFLRLRGKTYDYKILYSSITRLFLLSPDDLHVEMVQLKAKYEGKLEKKYDGPAHEVISRIFRGLSGKKIIAHHVPQCNLKAVQGTLFPLEKSLFFVAKQPHLVEFTDIHQNGSGTSSARTFDLKVISKTGPEVTFTSINKEEHDPIENYLTSKKMADPDLLGAVVEDSDDDEMQSVASDGSERPKPRAMDSDDESEADEDFEASESDGGSPSESDSEVSDRMSIVSGDLAVADAPKKKKKDGDAPKKGKKDKAAKKEDGPAKKKQKKNTD
ncbi:FACT complex subunit SSRP1 [Rhizoctonia solani]|uniref:FACT complex subunit POB3 n=1 Tax=Rhizoctonia solani TaxID=456999 RepID=A0A8H7M4D6_9AGAM|nr:FACT complex subunit SSRP1 [Rhizoctonia solani]